VVEARGEGAARHLVAYVVGADGGEPPAGELRGHLRGRVPDYMVPSRFVTLDSLPLTPSGKVNRRALPEPERESGGGATDAPQTPVEEALCAVWAEVLNAEQVGAHDNFFELGGHSLLATQVVTKVRESLGVEVPLRILFESPTVAELAAAIERLQSLGETPKEPEIAPIPRERFRASASIREALKNS
jgi:acyl carrier protein